MFLILVLKTSVWRGRAMGKSRSRFRGGLQGGCEAIKDRDEEELRVKQKKFTPAELATVPVEPYPVS